MTLILAWVVCTGALLTVYFVAQARVAQRGFEELGFRLGGAGAQFQVNWLDMWPQLLAIYLVTVVLPPLVFWLLWRRARGTSDG
jgi:hypothetical protein